MKRSNTTPRISGALLVVLALACGQKPEESGPEKSEAQAATQNASEPAPAPRPVPPPDESGLFTQIPDTAFMVFHLGRPVGTIARIRGLLEMLRLPSTTPELEKMKAETGLDISDPAFFKKIGVDDTRGIAAVLDKGPLLHIQTPDLSLKSKASLYFLVPLSDPTTFLQWMGGMMMATSNGQIRLENATLGDRKVSYVYLPAQGGEWFDVALVAQDDLLYIFVPSSSRPVPTPATPPEAVAAYKKELEAFFERVDNHLGKDATFLQARAKTETENDILFYINFSKAGPLFTDDPEELKSFQAIADVFPALALSLRMEAGKVTGMGVLQASPSLQWKMQKTLLPQTPPPAYATLFPENTGFFNRYYLNLLGLKEIFFAALPPEERADAESSFAQVKALLDSQLGFDLDKDVLGGLTGHFALGAPGLGEILAFLLTPRSVSTTSADPSGKTATETRKLPTPELPPITLIAQAASAKKGARLIEIIEKMLDTVDITLTREESDGQEIYSLQIPEEDLTLVFLRHEDLLVFSTSTEELKNVVERAKSPGASFVDKLGGEPLKQLVTGEAQSGMAINLSQLMGFFGGAPGVSPAAKAVLKRLSSLLKLGVFIGYYDEGSFTLTGEITLR